MAFSFRVDENWADEIARISTQAAYQTASVRFEDPSLVTRTYDVDTGKWTITGNPVIYEGRARVIGIRWGVHTGGESQANATTLKGVRVQLPYQATPRVKKGVKVFVTSAPRNPSLTQYMFAVTSDFQGSSAAARTIECALDIDVNLTPPVVNWLAASDNLASSENLTVMAA